MPPTPQPAACFRMREGFVEYYAEEGIFSFFSRPDSRAPGYDIQYKIGAHLSGQSPHDRVGARAAISRVT